MKLTEAILSDQFQRGSKREVSCSYRRIGQFAAIVVSVLLSSCFEEPKLLKADTKANFASFTNVTSSLGETDTAKPPPLKDIVVIEAGMTATGNGVHTYGKLAMSPKTTSKPRIEAPKFCPLDRVVFTDENSRHKFIPVRVAVNYTYKCGGSFTRVYHRPEPRLEQKCSARYGETIIDGTINGVRLIAIYSVTRGVPCCSWHIYSTLHEASVPKAKAWLRRNEMPVIEMGNEWDAIETSAEHARGGPVSNGKYIPSICRDR